MITFIKNFESLSDALQNEGEKTKCFLKLIVSTDLLLYFLLIGFFNGKKFFEKMNKPAERIRKIITLSDMHIYWGNFAEAAKCLLVLAEELNWKDQTVLKSVENLPTETACLRKVNQQKENILKLFKQLGSFN